MALTDIEIKRAKKAEKPYKLYDGRGLFLLVNPSGSKLWRMRYQFESREKLLSFGPYPEVPLARARERCLAARERMRAGEDPGVSLPQPIPQEVDPTHTFEAVAREWFATQKPRWTEKHAAQVIDSLAADIFPTLGGRDVAMISVPEMLAAIRGMERRRALETAHRVRQRCSAVFQHAIASGKAAADPAASLGKALAPVIRGHRPAITDLAEARNMLAKVEAEPAFPLTKLALRLLALTSVRSIELRLMEWREIEQLDCAEPLWRIPGDRMKMRREHLVPLARQAVEILVVAKPISAGAALVFPSSSKADQPMSENALSYLMVRAGYADRHVPHGWRATFSTVMNERFRGDREVIDLMLAHVSGDKTEAAYNRALHLARRRELAQAWADLLLESAAPAARLLEGLRKRPNSDKREIARAAGA